MESSCKAFRHTAAASGAFGRGIAADTQYNGLINDKGCKNTNKPGDLKVEAVNKVWQERVRDLKGNFTPLALERIAK